MKYRFLVLSLLFSLSLAAQQFSFSTNMGYARGETRRLKKFMLATGFSAGYEGFLRQGLAFEISVGASSLAYENSDSIGRSVFITRRFINLPLSLKKLYPLKAGSWAFVSAGLTGTYSYRLKEETRSFNINEKKDMNSPGYNMAATFSLGYRKQLNLLWSFDLGLSAQEDWLSSYSRDADWIKASKTMAFISLHRLFAK